MKKLLITVVIVVGILVLVAGLSIFVNLKMPFPDDFGVAVGWLGVLASYLGVIVSLLIAHWTEKNQNKLEEINKNNEALKRKVNSSIVGVNIRLSGVEFYPKMERLEQNHVTYHLIVRFENKANIMFGDIRLKKIKVISHFGSYTILPGNDDLQENAVRASIFEYKLQENTPIVEGDITVETHSPIEKLFTNFYFYYSQFSKGCRKLNVQLMLDIALDQNETVPICVDAELEALPEFNRRILSNVITVNDYKISFPMPFT